MDLLQPFSRSRGLEETRAISSPPCLCRMIACSKCTMSDMAKEVLFGTVLGMNAEL